MLWERGRRIKSCYISTLDLKASFIEAFLCVDFDILYLKIKSIKKNKYKIGENVKKILLISLALLFFGCDENDDNYIKGSILDFELVKDAIRK